MITYHKTGEHGLEVVDEIVKNCWINVVDPTPDELTELRELDIPPEFITYPLDLDERPRIEREEGYTLILLRVPYFQGDASDLPYTTIPLGIVLNGQWIMTICRHDHELLHEFVAGKVRGLATAKRNRFILRMLLATANKYLSYLREINRVVETLEDQLHDVHAQPGDAGAAQIPEKPGLLHHRAARSNELMMERLQRSRLFTHLPGR